jgi:hypothetical protein
VVHEHALKTQNEHAMAWAWLGIVEYALLRGDLPKAAEYLEKSRRVAHRMGLTERAWMNGLAARLHVMRDDWAAAREAAAATLALLRAVPLPNAYYTQEGYTAVAEACLALAERPGADAAAAADRAQLRRDTRLAMRRLRGFARSFPASRPAAHRIEGWHAWRTGRPGAARRHWRRAIAEAERLGKLFEKGLAYYDMGRFLPDGSGHLREAAEIFDGLRFEWYASRARALLAERLGVPLPDVRRLPDDPRRVPADRA